MTKKLEAERPKPARVGLRQQVLLAALDCSGGDLEKTFTAEDLLLAAWKRDPMAWGLRGHETEHPDSERIYVELDRASVRGSNVRGGLVGLGLFEKVRQRTYRLTPAGLATASEVAGADPSAGGKAERALADAVTAILSHPVFLEWMKEPTTPKHFRDAGHFWGVAPGTPPRVIRARIGQVDRTLEKAGWLLDAKRVEEIAARHGKALFDRTDIDRAMDFQATLKRRFSKDLSTLQVDVGLGSVEGLEHITPATPHKRAITMKAYLDTNILSAIVRDDYPKESEALDKLLEFAEAGKVEIVTSELTRKEIERYQGQQSKSVQRVYRLVGRVNFLEDHKLLGFHSESYPWGGGSFPLVEDDRISSELRQIGLERTDAHHLMLAIRAGCEVFLTYDEKTILKHRTAIEGSFPIKLMKPSELGARIA